MSIAEAQVEAEIETFDDKDPWYSCLLYTSDAADD